MKKLRHFRLSEHIGRPETFHYARSRFDGGVINPAHSHDYYEIFFIESGEGIHHINGRTQVLFRGSLVFIRPDRDVHAFSGHALVKWNVAFANSIF
ncbi:MAG: AraC family ligand binding domain-containing protein, partial [Spirochaetia bacterium]|nr:AraC family ligand binding domain-containing protein [Spirochaetia bacterium]